ncbi:hypothetical protein WA158_002391 [Blastocystis sp. Blastoise]
MKKTLFFAILLIFILCVSADHHDQKGFKKHFKKILEQHKAEENEKYSEVHGNGKWGHFKGDFVADNVEKKLHINKKHSHIEAWVHGILHSTVMILATEFGDKTFFITAILSMTQNKWAIWSGSVIALWLMTILSCFIGVILPAIIPPHVTQAIASLLFVFFGVKMLYDAKNMGDDNSEYEEAQDTLTKSNQTPLVSPTVLKEHGDKKKKSSFKALFIEVFVMIFFAEWGDRSQVSTILLASTNPIISVMIGGCFGHFICTTLATLTGSILAKKVSPRFMTAFGGILFLFFAVSIEHMD